ncbi:T9SS type A sorting domain-containing protein, partial [Xanthomarina sp. GH4-25]
VKQVADSPKINVNHLQAGIYLVKIFTDNGQITKKIIVE